MKISFNPQRNTEFKNDMKVPYAPARRSVSKTVWWALLCAVFAPFVWLLAVVCFNWLMVISPGAVTMETWTVAAPAGGVVSEVAVQEGSYVKQGALLAAIKRAVTPEEAAETDRLRAELAELEAADTAPRTTVSGGAGEKEQRELMAYLLREEQAMKRLMEQGAATRAEYNQAKERRLGAEQGLAASLPRRAPDASWNAAASAMKLRKSYITRYLSAAESSLAKPLCVYASRAGRVQSIASEPGTDAAGGQALFVMADDTRPYIVAYVSPKDYTDRMSAGNTATVEVLGSGRSFEAKVVRPPYSAGATPGTLSERWQSETDSVAVWLRPAENLPPSEAVNGLPVEVKWGFRLFDR